MGDAHVVIADDIFQPWPVGGIRAPPQHQQFFSQDCTYSADLEIPFETPEIFMDTNQAEGPSAWRSEALYRW